MCIMILSHLTPSNKYPLMSDVNKEHKIVTEKKSDGRSPRVCLPPHPTKNKNLGKVTKPSPSYIRTACYVCGALQSLHFHSLGRHGLQGRGTLPPQVAHSSTGDLSHWCLHALSHAILSPSPGFFIPTFPLPQHLKTHHSHEALLLSLNSQ